MFIDKSIQKVKDKYEDKYDLYECMIGDDFYIYKLITEGEYHMFISMQLNELELQDAIVSTCILYPENLDIDDMYAGDVTELAKLITSQSCIDLADRKALIEMYREEMSDLDNQMICFITKAFPSYKLTDLEKLDYPRLYKLYTRAEWILVNIENWDITSFLDPVESFDMAMKPEETIVTNNESKKEINEEQKENNIMGRNLDEVLQELSKKDKTPVTQKRKKMTAEEEKAFREFQTKFPELHMEADAMFTGAESMNASTVKPALRTPGEH